MLLMPENQEIHQPEKPRCTFTLVKKALSPGTEQSSNSCSESTVGTYCYTVICLHKLILLLALDETKGDGECGLI